MKKISFMPFVLIFIAALALVASGCEDRSALEEAADETTDAVEEAGDEIEDATD